MTDNELELLELIKNQPNPEQAILIAIEIISDFLKQPESFE